MIIRISKDEKSNKICYTNIFKNTGPTNKSKLINNHKENVHKHVCIEYSDENNAGAATDGVLWYIGVKLEPQRNRM